MFLVSDDDPMRMDDGCNSLPDNDVGDKVVFGESHSISEQVEQGHRERARRRRHDPDECSNGGIHNLRPCARAAASHLSNIWFILTQLG